MPVNTVLIVLAVAGALCLALRAAGTRGLPGGLRWGGLQRGQDEEEKSARVSVYAVELLAREMLLRQLRAQFGELPPPVAARFESEDAEWCVDLTVRLRTANSLEELGLAPAGDGPSPVSTTNELR